MPSVHSQKINSPSQARSRTWGFTLVELLVVIAIVAILASLLLTVLARAKASAQGIYCLNNARQLAIAWMVYASDHNDRLAYNLGRPASQTNMNNWAAGVLDWELTPDNTNTLLLVEAGLGAYSSKTAKCYHCPADYVLSALQKAAGWQYRVRSYSMNASVGDAGDFSTRGYNINNPAYVQFFKLTDIPRPADIFVFLDEHPDTIGDGYFLNRLDDTYGYDGWGGANSSDEWLRLPASYHNGGTSFSFADGHVEVHHWIASSTKQPSQPDSVVLPLTVPANQTSDFDWMAEHATVNR